MERGKKIGMLLMVAVLALGLLASVQEPCAQTTDVPCYTANSSGNLALTDLYKIRPSATNPVSAACNDPQTGQAIPCYKLQYEFIGSLSGINQIDMLVPVCSANPIITYFPADSTQGCLTQVYDTPGQGDPSLGFGVGVFQSYNVRTASNMCLRNFYILTSSPALAPTSLGFKAGRTAYYCGPVVGPGCVAPGFIPVNNVEEKRVGKNREHLIKIHRNPATWCADIIEWCSQLDSTGACTGSWQILDPEPQPVNIDGVVNHLINCGSSDGNQKCQECLIYSNAIPCTYIYSGGSITKVPKGCPIP